MSALWALYKGGLTITFPSGKTAFLQGDEAYRLNDELDNCPSEEIQQNILSQYDIVAE